jgi:hypothetical protein
MCNDKFYIFISIAIFLALSYVLYNYNSIDEFDNYNIIDNYMYNHSKHINHYGHYDFIRSDLVHNTSSLNTKINN